MASIHKRPQSRYYTAAFYGPDGRRMQVSTKQTDKRLAQAAADEFERAARLARHGELAEAQARKIVNDLMERAGSGERLRTVTTEDHFKSWLTGKGVNRSAGTATRYAPVVRDFLDSLGTRAGKPLASLTPGDVERYVNALGQRGLSGRTIGLHVAAIRTALNAARRKGIIPTNVAEAVERPAVVERKKGLFTEAETALLLAAAEGEWKTLLLVGIYTGLRLGDCAGIKWANIDLGGTITLTMQKTGKEITIPTHPALLAHFERLASTDSPEEFVMPTLATKRHGGRHGLSRSFLDLLRKAGVAATDSKGHKRSFHFHRVQRRRHDGPRGRYDDRRRVRHGDRWRPTPRPTQRAYGPGGRRVRDAYDEDRQPTERDPLDAADQDFDWRTLYARLNEDLATEEPDPRLAQVVLRLLQMLLPLSGRRIQPESLGLRLIALAWILNPGYFAGSPSVRRLARRCGVRIAPLAHYTGFYSRLLRFRNRGQRHAWNWRRDRAPRLRGRKARRVLKRNVPPRVT